jgi:YesN/AraC family two-component response regulator
MAYKVFLVEDEIVTRHGIRSSVDWAASGYEFCGEAPDGELALPLIRERKPDAVITDIKMPFMDGLQLCRILRETLPGIKMIILSGHDEFAYAQEAIRIGVTEYLLKPVTPDDLSDTLRKVACQLDAERQEAESLRALHERAAALHPMLGDQPPLGEKAHSHSALIARARAYIDANYAQPELSLGSVAAQVLLSPSYFSVVFSREVGETFIEYLTHVRIRRAIELLRTTELSSSEIAYQIGYHNPRYFYAVFRKVAGLPPNEYRRQAYSL